jgi:hypothetical protein
MIKTGYYIVIFAAVLMFNGCITKYVEVERPGPQDQPAMSESGIPANAVMPRVMLLIDEKSLGTIATSEVESMAVKKIRAAKGTVVDQDMVRANVKRNQQLLKSVGDSRGAAAMGQEYGADVIIVGEAVAKPSARRIAESNLRTYEAAVTLRAIRTDTSETIASASESASVFALEDVSGGSKALKTAGGKSIDALLPDMITEWTSIAKSQSKAGSVIVVSVGGVDQMWKLKKIREKLEKTEGINKVTQRSFASGAVVFEVEASTASEVLAEKIVSNPPDGLKYQSLGVMRAKIELRAVSAGR